jgi:hypothetical protein
MDGPPLFFILLWPSSLSLPFPALFDLASLHYFFLIGDFTVALALLVGFFLARRGIRISIAYSPLFWIGCFIGATWAFTFLFFGHGFFPPVPVWPYGLSGWPRPLSPSIWDGGIFMVGIFLCDPYLKGPLFNSFHKNELFVMLSWGLFPELFVEYLFYGRVWIYDPLPWNPIIIPPLPGTASLSPGSTLIPPAVWVVAPILFYLICLNVMKEKDFIR